jgi:aminoglycoside 6'-N-acetyltransferase
MTTGPIELRPLEMADLPQIRGWLQDPGVARWYLVGSSVAEELAALHRCVLREEPTEALLATWHTKPVGWCQWYLCRDYPDHAAGVGAAPEDAGIDYAIGEPSHRGRGLGKNLIATLVAYVRSRHPGAGIIADPEATNHASRSVLERNGFILLDERAVPSERLTTIMAIYRLPPATPAADQ